MEDPELSHLAIVGNLGDRARSRTDRQILARREIDPIGRVTLHDDLLQLLTQPGVAVSEIGGKGGVLMLNQVGPAYQLAEPIPELVLDAREENHLAVRGGIELVLDPIQSGRVRVRQIGAVGHQMIVQVECRGDPRVGHNRGRGGHVDISALPCPVTLDQSSGHMESRMDRTGRSGLPTASQIPLNRRWNRRANQHPCRSIGIDYRRMCPGESFHHQPVRGDTRVWPLCAIAGVLAVHDASLAPPLLLIPDSEAVSNAGEIPIDEDIGGLVQSPEQLPSALLAQVEGQTPLVLVHLNVGRTVMRRDNPTEVADVITQEGALDLHHIGAEIPEQGADRAAVEQRSQLENADTMQ